MVNISIHSLFTTHNNGFDLSLSFSLIAQSKAPLENYGANIGFDLDFTVSIAEFVLLVMITLSRTLNEHTRRDCSA